MSPANFWRVFFVLNLSVVKSLQQKILLNFVTLLSELLLLAGLVCQC